MPKTPDWLPEQPWSNPAGTLVVRSSADRDEWLASRQSLIGSSDIAKVMRASKYGGPYTVWAEKSGLTGDQPPNVAMIRGQDFEDVIVAHWAKTRAGFPIVTRRQGLVRSKAHPRVGATVDRLSCCLADGVASRCIVEVKSQANWDEWLDDEVPAAFQLQGLWQLAATGREHVHFVAMDGRYRVEHRIIDRDEELIAVMIARAEELWRRVEDNDPPEPDSDDLDAIKRAHRITRTGKGDVFVVPDELAEHVHAMQDAAKDEAEAKTRKNTAAAILQTAAGSATELVWPDGEPVATWRAGSTIDGLNADFRRAYPELVERYSVPVPDATELDLAKLVEGEPWLLERGILRRRRTWKPKGE